MARRFPTFVALLPLLAACATTAPMSEDHLVTSPDGEAVYLNGITTRYSVRLDELRAKQGSSRVDRLPHAVVAGDATMTVAGSLFRHHDVFALDLVLRNHSKEPLLLERAQIDLIDDEDRTLHQKAEWAQGMNYGLRALQVRSLSFRPMGTDHQSGQAGVHGGSQESNPIKPSLSSATRMDPAIRSIDTPMDVRWISDVSRTQDFVTVPSVLEIGPGEAGSYWAYWDAVEVSYPVTVSLRIGGKRMLLRFDAPSQGSRTAR